MVVGGSADRVVTLLASVLTSKHAELFACILGLVFPLYPSPGFSESKWLRATRRKEQPSCLRLSYIVGMRTSVAFALPQRASGKHQSNIRVLQLPMRKHDDYGLEKSD